MEKNQIEKIYIVRNTDDIQQAYVEKFLIQYTNHEEVYGALPFSYDRLSPLEKEQAKEELRSQLVHQYLSKLSRDEYHKIVVISKDNLELLHSVDRRIQSLKQKDSFGIGPLDVSRKCSLFNLLTAKGQPKFHWEDQHAKTIFRQLRTKLSLFILSFAAFFGMKHFSVDLDAFVKNSIGVSFQKGNNKDHNVDVIFADSGLDDSSFVTLDDATVNVLMGALKRNPLVDQRDARIAQNLRQYLVENPYFDYDYCYKVFSDLEIVHLDEQIGDIGAVTSSSENLIFINDVSCSNHAKYETDLEHELTHFTGFLSCMALNEGMTCLINYEYMNNFKLSNDYFDELLITKILCELITPEKMLEAYSTRDDMIIREELLKINEDPQIYDHLVDLLNQYYNDHFEYAKDGRIPEFTEYASKKYKQKLIEVFSNYLNTSSITSDQEKRISIYLSYLCSNSDVYGVIYLNREVNIPGWVKAYNDSSNLNSVVEAHSFQSK